MATKTYRSLCGDYYFRFRFYDAGNYYRVYCLSHPGFNGQDPDSHKSHIYSSGELCFIEGREPSSESRAEDLAQQWAEYFLEYRQTGSPQY